ncbi:PP2C-domain-containing protein [Rozella allomycis CSF55]|uniref:protein-serine/threonine phosphatase n=1 Tax=Rozella allomycis (strain CSF55) TaxID=988480 RepID=A0A4V1IZU7_ROZAC|nr:PP2C-domain-containing protein [Rozella allomycis CSF55]
MGHTLSEPITEKHSTSTDGSRLLYGASSMQGWRVTMEDAHTTLLEMKGYENMAFFAVFDGHGGANVAKFCGERLHTILAEQESFKTGNFRQSLIDTFLKADATLRILPEFKDEQAGCTAVVTLISNDRIICGNAGDSRAVLCSKGEAIPLSHDHKPMDPDESARIVNAGGFVEAGRVNGALALSRAIGDFNYKNPELAVDKQLVISYPDVIEQEMGPDDEFIVMACDGIWDCFTNQQVVNFVREKIAAGVELDKICEQLMDRCLAPKSMMTGIGCDNMTIVIVGLLQGDTKEKWIQKCSRPSNFHAEPHLGRIVQKLDNSWTFWFMHRSPTAKNLTSSYGDNIKKIASFDTVEGFWGVYSHLKRATEVPSITEYNLFKSGIKPMWEYIKDTENQNGGKIMLRLRKGVVTRLWEKLILVVIGNQNHFSSDICGLVLSIRQFEDIISVWNKTSSDKDLIQDLKNKLAELLELPSGTIVDYKVHNSHHKDQT